MLCLILISCKNEKKMQIKEIEVLNYERYGIDTILPKFYNCINSSGKTFAVSNHQKNKFKYITYEFNDFPIDQTFEKVEGVWKENLPSIVGGAYCIKINYRDKKSKIIYIENDKIYSNSSLFKFLEKINNKNKISEKIFGDTLKVNSKMKQLINFVVEDDSRISRSPPPPIIN